MAPSPWHRLLPTGGVDASEASLGAWIKAGAAAVGMGSKLITAPAVQSRDFEAIAQIVAQYLRWIQKARGVPLFLGVEHLGLYPHQAAANEISHWYADTFGFECAEGKSSLFLSGSGAGRIEVQKEPAETRLHIAVRVSDFDGAVDDLRSRGIGVRDVIVKPGLKATYLESADPDGNLVHLLWRADR
jgi:hypothetical protein